MDVAGFAGIHAVVRVTWLVCAPVIPVRAKDRVQFRTGLITMSTAAVAVAPP